MIPFGRAPIVTVTVERVCHSVDQIAILIRIHEYMCRFMILATHYCFADTDFFSSRNKSLGSWFAKLVEFYVIALKQGKFDCLQNCAEFMTYYTIYANNLRQKAKNDRVIPIQNASRLDDLLEYGVENATTDRYDQQASERGREEAKHDDDGIRDEDD